MLQLDVGQVFHLWCTGCRNPKWKYHVIALIDPRPRYFIINTNPPAFYKSEAELMSHQIPLAQAEHRFLRHDSFMDSSVLLGGPTASDIEDAYEDDQRILLGTVSTKPRRHARSVITASDLLSPAEIAALLHVW